MPLFWLLGRLGLNPSKKRINLWLLENVLTIKAKKPKYLTFGHIENYEEEIAANSLYIHNCENNVHGECERIERVSNHRYLGVIIDQHLSWEPHIDYIHSKLKKFLFIFFNIRRTVNEDMLKTIYYTLVQSILQFGIIAWGSAVKTHKQKIIILQKCILKVMFRKWRRFPTSEIYDVAKCFSIDQLYIKNVLMFFHKYPNIVNIPQESSCYDTRFQLSGKVVNPRIRLTQSTRSPIYALHCLYNKIDDSLRSPADLSRDAYKKTVYTWLIKLGHVAANNFIKSEYVL